jgi:hypothetical protein
MLRVSLSASLAGFRAFGFVGASGVVLSINKSPPCQAETTFTQSLSLHACTASFYVLKAHTVTNDADLGFAVPDFAEELSEGGRSSPGGKRIPVMRMEDKLFHRVQKCSYTQDNMEFSVSTGYQQFSISTRQFFKRSRSTTRKGSWMGSRSNFSQRQSSKSPLSHSSPPR